MAIGMAQKNIVVTGATSGIGYQAALDLAAREAFVIGIGRDEGRCERARKSILQAHPAARVTYLVADLSSQVQVRSLAVRIRDVLAANGTPALHVLVNNAGTYSSSRQFSVDGIELTMAVNHLAPFLLTHLLCPVLARSTDGRVLTVSSDDHYYPYARVNISHLKDPKLYIGYFRYAQTKLCNVLFSAEFNRRTSGGVQAWAIDPGLVSTDIVLKDPGFFSRLVWKVRQKQGGGPQAASDTICHLASDALEEISGALYWKDSRPLKPNKVVGDVELTTSLWQESCRLCGIDRYFSI